MSDGFERDLNVRWCARRPLTRALSAQTQAADFGAAAAATEVIVSAPKDAHSLARSSDDDKLQALSEPIDCCCFLQKQH